MAIKLAQKKEIVEKVQTLANNALSVVLAEYRGLSVSDTTTFRQKARKSGVVVCVLRNTLAKRAFQGTSFECLNDALVGPLMFLFSNEDPGASARVARDFAKDNEKLKVKALSLGGTLLEARDLERIAKLPTRIEAIAQLVTVMNAPITKFVRTLAEPSAKFVRVLAAVRDQKK